MELISVKQSMKMYEDIGLVLSWEYIGSGSEKFPAFGPAVFRVII